MTAAFSEVRSCPRSGRYQFRYWHYDQEGRRTHALSRPPLDRQGSCPDLVSTAYKNHDGSQTVYGLTFDLDAHRAEVKWLDGDGRLDWPAISRHLADHHLQIFTHIAYAVRSTGGKGIALLLAITPLPLQETTEGNQRTALNLQSRLIDFFSSLGLGADPGARGLVRDYPNFQNAERLLYENRLALRRAEQFRPPVLKDLHTYLNQLIIAQRREARLYNDARTEAKLARLFAYLAGIQTFLGLPMRGYLAFEAVWLTPKELVELTGLSLSFVRQLLRSPPAWLIVRYESRQEGWRLSLSPGRIFQRLLPRAEWLLSAPGRQGPILTVGRIALPHLVGEDERNRWLTSLALTYKWHGYSQEEALAKIKLRLAHVIGHETSRNCREVRSIVRAIYRNEPHMAGRFSSRPLPEWLVNDQIFEMSTSTRRGVAPDPVEGGSGLVVPACSTPAGSCPPGVAAVSEGLRLVPGLVASPLPEVSSPSIGPEAPIETGRKALVAVRHRQRVGLFDVGQLVACFTRRHYRAQEALRYLARRPEYAAADLYVYTPSSHAQAAYHSAISAVPRDGVLCSGDVLGRPKTGRERLADWAERQGIVSPPTGHLDEAPF